MSYIVFDLEFNQNDSTYQTSRNERSSCSFEIIQIGAVKLDSNLTTLATFNRYVKPTIFPQVSPIITELTGITTETLMMEETFPNVFNDYVNFIGDKDSIFCTWGMSDMKVLYKNVAYHMLEKTDLPLLFINLQPYTSLHLNFPHTKLLKLQTSVEMLNISMPYPFHNALYDAYYTAEIFKKIKSPAIQPKKYDPNYRAIPPRQKKKVVDYEKLLLQFEKMLDRKLNTQEQDMIILAYKMGKTNQFLK